MKLLARDGDAVVADAASRSRLPSLLQELGKLRARQPPLRSDLPAFQIAGFEARDHVGFGDAEHLRGVGRAQRLRHAAGSGGAAADGVACAAMPPGWFSICCAMAMPTAISAPTPAAPAPPFSNPCAI